MSRGAGLNIAVRFYYFTTIFLPFRVIFLTRGCTMSTLIAYVRVSSENQKENTSLGDQRARIEAYCNAVGHELVAYCWDVETASGMRKRPGLAVALDAVYAGHADGIICLKLDRFARSTIEGLNITAELQSKAKDLVILDLNLDTTTPIGQCVLTILLAFAQLERNTINERCRRGQKAVKDAGGYFSGHPPFGWDAHEKKLVINPLEQQVRGLIFKWREEGLSFNRIAGRLNEHEIPAKRGGKWFADTVRDVIQAEYKLADYKLLPLLDGASGNERAS